MKNTLIIFFMLTGCLCQANMSSPVWEGTRSSSAFSSKNIDILREKIHITIDQEFRTAHYVVEYHIRSDSSGVQIPLLFHAQDFKENFKVWADGKEVSLLHIPAGYISTANSPFSGFANAFDRPTRPGEPETVVIYWEPRSGYVYRLEDLKYFEVALDTGEHTIRIEYAASPWSDVSDWVTEYSFRYSLSPAKYWRSFGSLEIIVDASANHSDWTTNLGTPVEGRIDSVATWHFSKLPGNYIELTYKPDISAIASILIALGPIGLTLLVAALLITLHLYSIKRFRKHYHGEKRSWIVVVGSLVIPFLILAFFMLSFPIIDAAIGDPAGEYHGYTFLIMLLYPLFAPVYWLIMWQADKAIARRILNSTEQTTYVIK